MNSTSGESWSKGAGLGTPATPLPQGLYHAFQVVTSPEVNQPIKHTNGSAASEDVQQPATQETAGNAQLEPTYPPSTPPPSVSRARDEIDPQGEQFYSPTAAELYQQSQVISPQAQAASPSAHSPNPQAEEDDPTSRLPPVMQVEKQTVTSNATQSASTNRRKTEAHFACPVPGCGSTFTRRFNLRG